MHENKNVLLVPKPIVRKRYVFNVECYIKQYILKTLQEFHVANNTDMCVKKEYKNGEVKIHPPTLKELYSKEVKGKSPKEYAYSCSNINPNEDIFLVSINTPILIERFNETTLHLMAEYNEYIFYMALIITISGISGGCVKYIMILKRYKLIYIPILVYMQEYGYF